MMLPAPRIEVFAPRLQGDHWIGSGTIRFGESERVWVTARVSDATIRRLAEGMLRGGSLLRDYLGAMQAAQVSGAPDLGSILQGIASAIPGGIPGGIPGTHGGSGIPAIPTIPGMPPGLQGIFSNIPGALPGILSHLPFKIPGVSGFDPYTAPHYAVDPSAVGFDDPIFPHRIRQWTRAHVRPGHEEPVFAELPQGTHVRLDNRAGEWSLVAWRHPVYGPGMGWVMSSHVGTPEVGAATAGPGEALIKILPGWNPSYLANAYVGDPARWAELIAVNGMTISPQGVPSPWAVGQTIKIPASWNGVGKPPPGPQFVAGAPSGARAVPSDAYGPPGPPPPNPPPGVNPDEWARAYEAGKRGQNIPGSGDTIPTGDIPGSPGHEWAQGSAAPPPPSFGFEGYPGGPLDGSAIGAERRKEMHRNIAHSVVSSGVVKAALDVAESMPNVGTSIRMARRAADIAEGLSRQQPEAIALHERIASEARRENRAAVSLLRQVEMAHRALRHLRQAERGDRHARAELHRLQEDARRGLPEAVRMQYVVEGARDAITPDYRNEVADIEPAREDVDPGLFGAEQLHDAMGGNRWRRPTPDSQEWLRTELSKCAASLRSAADQGYVGCPSR